MANGKDAIIDFIVSQLKTGKQRGEILAKVGETWRTPPRTFDRYLKTAQERYAASQQEIKQAIKVVEVAGAVEATKRQILTAIERKELLTKIALGEVKIPDIESAYNKDTGEWSTLDILKLPDHKARITAIAELNKMDGDYTPIISKVEMTTSTHEINLNIS